MTPRQIELARHALGLPNERNRSYRNRFFVGGNGADHMEWLSLCGADLATVEPGKRMDHFELTEAGARVALLPGETLDPEDFPHG